MTNKEIEEIFEDIFFEDDYVETSRLHSPEFSNGEFETLHVSLYGGMNGWGESKDYCYDLFELIEALESNGIYAYIVKMDIDALDDLFKVELELRDFEEFYKGKPE